MQTANVLVSIGGDPGNTVPLTGVTAAEVAVLLRIHGNDAVHDIDPQGDIQRSNREELARLKAKYLAKDEDGKAIVEGLYPGSAARVFATFEELELPYEHYKAKTRVVPQQEVPVPDLPDLPDEAFEADAEGDAYEPEELDAAEPGAPDPEPEAAPAPKRNSRKPTPSVLD